MYNIAPCNVQHGAAFVDRIQKHEDSDGAGERFRRPFRRRVPPRDGQEEGKRRRGRRGHFGRGRVRGRSSRREPAVFEHGRRHRRRRFGADSRQRRLAFGTRTGVEYRRGHLPKYRPLPQRGAQKENVQLRAYSGRRRQVERYCKVVTEQTGFANSVFVQDRTDGHGDSAQGHGSFDDRMEGSRNHVLPRIGQRTLDQSTRVAEVRREGAQGTVTLHLVNGRNENNERFEEKYFIHGLI